MRALVLGLLAALCLAAVVEASETKGGLSGQSVGAASPPAAGGTNAWTISDRTSGLDGTGVYIAQLDADNAVEGARGQNPKPNLHLECDHNGFFIYVNWPDVITKKQVSDPETFAWRLDDGPVKRWTWMTMRHALFEPGGRAFDAARQWSAGQVLIIRVDGDKYGEQEATFHLSGMAQVVDHISHMNCG